MNAFTIRENESLRQYNSFGIAAKAKFFSSVSNVESLKHALQLPLSKAMPVFILGGGSNILLTKDIAVYVIKIEIRGVTVLEEHDDFVELKVGAGELWHPFVMHCIEKNWAGLENLSLIPGTVGAAPMQNIGAYGVEVKDAITSVEVLMRDSLETRTFLNKECHFAYRDSIFKNELKDKCIITHVNFRLRKKNHQYNVSYGAIQDVLKAKGKAELNLKKISDAVIEIRQSKLPDPAKLGNAGSFFKNPTLPISKLQSLQNKFGDIPHYVVSDKFVKLPAAWLIEQCRWKGKRIGAVGVHEKQALVIVNYGDAKGEEIWQLAMQIKASVKEKFDVDLHPEVNIIA